MVGNGSRKFVKVKFKSEWNGSKSHGSKSKICQVSSDGNRKLNGNLKLQNTAEYSFSTVQIGRYVKRASPLDITDESLASSLVPVQWSSLAPPACKFRSRNANSNMSECDGKCKSEISTSCSIKHVVFPRRWPRKIRHRVTRCLHTHTHTHTHEIGRG